MILSMNFCASPYVIMLLVTYALIFWYKHVNAQLSSRDQICTLWPQPSFASKLCISQTQEALWILNICLIFMTSTSFLVCSLQPCGHLLGKSFCKSGNFHEGFNFCETSHMRSFMKIILLDMASSLCCLLI